MKCEHCGTRIEDGEPFRYGGHDFCAECMSSLTSWFLDGGVVTDPELFSYVSAHNE